MSINLSAKLNRTTREIFHGVVEVGQFQSLLDRGWKIVHDPGTAHVALHHDNGGRTSLIEVKTYGTFLTVGEADEVARVVAELLRGHYESSSKEFDPAAKLKLRWKELDRDIHENHLAIRSCRWFQYSMRRRLMEDGLVMIYKAAEIRKAIEAIGCKLDPR